MPPIPPRVGEIVDHPFLGPTEVLHAVTRMDLIADGSLVPAPSLVPDEPSFVAESGWRVPVALSASVAALVRPTEEETRLGQDIKGRLWDVLSMARLYFHHAPLEAKQEGFVPFKCIFVLAGREGLRGPVSRTYDLRVGVHGGDDGEWVATLLQPGEE